MQNEIKSIFEKSLNEGDFSSSQKNIKEKIVRAVNKNIRSSPRKINLILIDLNKKNLEKISKILKKKYKKFREIIFITYNRILTKFFYIW